MLLADHPEHGGGVVTRIVANDPAGLSPVELEEALSALDLDTAWDSPVEVVFAGQVGVVTQVQVFDVGTVALIVEVPS